MAKSLQQQLLDGWERVQERSGMTLADLRSEAGLDCDLTSLGRKLRGKQVMTTSEAELISTALRVRLAFGREARSL